MLPATWKSFLRNLFLRNRVEQDLDAELGSYVEQLTQEKIAAGMSPEKAIRAARLELGGVAQVKEQVREVRNSARLEVLIQDLRYAVRMLRKNIGFSVVAILTLALGIGANTAIFSVVKGVLLRPLSYGDPDQLVRISTDWAGGFTDGGVSGPEFLDYKEQATSFQDAALHSSVGSMNVGFGVGEPERVPRVLVTSNIFSVLKVKAALGRTFTSAEDVPGNHRVLVLSHGLWVRRFGGDPGSVGKTVDVHGVAHTIIGVMPPEFAFPTKETAIWRPLGVNLAERNRNARSLRMVARYKSGTTLTQAQTQIGTIAHRLGEKYPANYPKESGFSPRVYPLREYIVGSLRTPLFVLSAAVGFVLLIACANVANLILARAGAREKELAVRAALGAGRARLMQQALTESVLLSLLGGGLALLLAYGGLKVLIASSPASIPRLSEVAIEPGVLAFTFLLSFLTGLIVGCAAAWRFYRTDVNIALKEGGRDSHGVGRQKLRSALVISEVALAAALLVGSGLLIRGFLRLQQVSPGFQPKGVLTTTISLLHLRYTDPAPQVQFFEQLIQLVATKPAVESVAAIYNAPFSGWLDDQAFAIEGRTLVAEGLYPDEEVRVSTPGYFQTLGVPVLQGRDFAASDKAETLPVAVISDSLARKHWPAGDSIGKRIKIGGLDSESPWSTIVGIVGDVRHNGLSQDIRPILYLPMTQSPQNTMTLVVRSTQDPVALAATLRSAARQIDPSLPLYEIRTMDEAISESVAQPRFTFRLMTIFATLALLLASVGIYGTLAYTILQRTQEIAIRIALGASSSAILRMVCGDAMRLAGTGLLLGIAGGIAVSRVLTSLLFGLNPFDPGAYIGVSALILVVALVAVLIPARRALRVHPLVALRYQ